MSCFNGAVWSRMIIFNWISPNVMISLWISSIIMIIHQASFLFTRQTLITAIFVIVEVYLLLKNSFLLLFLTGILAPWLNLLLYAKHKDLWATWTPWQICLISVCLYSTIPFCITRVQGHVTEATCNAYRKRCV